MPKMSTTPIIVQAAVVTSRNSVLAKLREAERAVGDDQVPVGDQAGDAGDHERHREGGDQRVDAEERGDHAVDRADPDADEHADEDREDRVTALGHLRRDHLAQRVGRADRQVDAARDHHHRARRRDDQVRGLLVEDLEQVRPVGEERALPDREHQEQAR